MHSIGPKKIAASADIIAQSAASIILYFDMVTFLR